MRGTDLPFFVSGCSERDMGQIAETLPEQMRVFTRRWITKGAKIDFSPETHVGLIILGDSKDWATSVCYQHDASGSRRHCNPARRSLASATVLSFWPRTLKTSSTGSPWQSSGAWNTGGYSLRLLSRTKAERTRSSGTSLRAHSSHSTTRTPSRSHQAQQHWVGRRSTVTGTAKRSASDPRKRRCTESSSTRSQHSRCFRMRGKMSAGSISFHLLRIYSGRSRRGERAIRAWVELAIARRVERCREPN